MERDYITLPSLHLSTGQQLSKLAETSTVDISEPGYEMPRATHEVFASLVDYFRDYRDCASDYPESAKFAVYDEMQELVDTLKGLGVSIHYATREVHLKVAGEPADSKPLSVQMSYLIGFERGKNPTEFSVQKKIDFRF